MFLKDSCTVSSASELTITLNSCLHFSYTSFLLFYITCAIITISFISCNFAYAQNSDAEDKILISFGVIEQPTLYSEQDSVHAFWNKETEEDDVTFGKSSKNSGSSFGKSVNLAPSFYLAGVSASNNYVYVTWEDENFSPDHSVIALKRSSDNGMTYGDSIIVSDKSLHAVNPKIVSAGNNVFIIWQSKPNNNTENFDIFFRSSSDSGVTFGDIVNLSNNSGYSDLDSSDDYSVHMAADESNVYIIWKDRANEFQSLTYGQSLTFSPEDLYFTFSTDNGKTFHEPKILVHGQEYSQVFVRNFENNVYVVVDDFATNKDVILLTSRDNGKVFSEPINLSNNKENEPTSSTQFVLDKDNLYLLWSKESENLISEDVFLVASHDKGITFEEPIGVSSGILANYKNVDWWDNVSPRMTASDNRVYVIWDNAIETLDFDEIHNLLVRSSTDYGKTFDIPKVVSKDIGENSVYDISAQNDTAYILYLDSPTKYTSESESDNYELYFMKASISGTQLENAKQYEGGGPKEITLAVNVESDPVILPAKQVINVAASDTMSDEPLAGAEVDVTVDYDVVTQKHFTGMTDDLGRVSFSWTIGKYNIPGTYSVETQISAEGYASTSDDIEFEVESESDDE